MYVLPPGPVCSLKARPRYGVSFVSSRLDPFSTFLIAIAICNTVRHLGCSILRRTMHGYSVYIIESAFLAIVREIHWLWEYPHKGSRMQKSVYLMKSSCVGPRLSVGSPLPGSQYPWQLGPPFRHGSREAGFLLALDKHHNWFPKRWIFLVIAAILVIYTDLISAKYPWQWQCSHITKMSHEGHGIWNCRHLVF